MERLKWEDSLKESIFNVFKDYPCIQKMKDNTVEEVLFSLLTLKRRENQRYGFKEVYFSKELKLNEKYNDYIEEIEEIKINFINDKFSDNIKRLSDRHKKDVLFKDEMLNTLNIEHFHLGNNDERTNDSLFVMYHVNIVYFIDIFVHKNFLDDTIIKILVNNWKSNISLNSYENKYYFPNIENKERLNMVKKLRVNPFPYQIENITVLSKMILSNGQDVEDHGKVQYIKSVIRHFEDNSDHYSNILYDILKRSDKHPNTLAFSVVLLDDYEVWFEETNSKTFFWIVNEEIGIKTR